VLPIEQGIVHDWKRSHGDIVKLVEERLIESLAWEGWPESKVVLRDNVQDVFIESVLNDHRISSIIFSTVNE
jgi:hypothetical protein